MKKVVISDRIRFKKSLLPASVIKKRYDRSIYDEVKCDNCQNLEDRHNDICDGCDAFKGRYRFFSREEAAKGIWSLPQGDIIAVKKTLSKKYGGDIQFIDKRNRIPFDNPIKFTGTLYGPDDTDEDGNPLTDQQSIVNKWLKYKHGVLRCRPRTGKTVMATYLYCKMGQKTVIIASQKEWLKQFYESATGFKPPKWRGGKKIDAFVPAQRRKAVTNIGSLQKKTGKEIIRYVESFSQLKQSKEHYDVILLTYQSLMRDPRRIIKYLNNRYSFCVVDEQHRGSAHAFLRVLATLNVAHRLSLSATTKRRDSRDIFGHLIMGPVVAESTTNALIPHIKFEKTPFSMHSAPKRWNTALRRVSFDMKRNRFIVQKVFKDLRDGHRVIIIPVHSKEHMFGLAKMINRQAKLNFNKKGEDWPKELAKCFHAQADRDNILEWVDSKKWDVPPIMGSKKKREDAPRVLVAISSMVREGIDFARPSALYIVVPLSGNSRAGSPAFDQMANRVCTIIPGKKQPIIRILVDEVDMFKGALSGLLWHEIFPNSNMKNKSDPRYFFSSEEYLKAKTYTAKSKKKDSYLFRNSWI